MSDEEEYKPLDWAWLYYMATVELRMSEKEFWNCTHRKLQALLKIHFKVLNKRNNIGKEVEEVYGDTISL